MLTLQDIHKEFDEKYFEVYNDTDHFGIDGHSPIHEFGFKRILGNEMFTIIDVSNIKKFYDKKIVEILKECIPEEAIIVQEDSASSNNEEVYFYIKAYNKCRLKLIENLRARNINLD